MRLAEVPRRFFKRFITVAPPRFELEPYAAHLQQFGQRDLCGRTFFVRDIDNLFADRHVPSRSCSPSRTRVRCACEYYTRSRSRRRTRAYDYNNMYNDVLDTRAPPPPP
jgi:hypothetical protein